MIQVQEAHFIDRLLLQEDLCRTQIGVDQLVLMQNLSQVDDFQDKVD